MKVIIIGGVAGGASAAARLRRLYEKAQILILERGEYVSFANCGLPYYIGEEIKEKSALTLQTPDSFHKRFRIEVRIQNEAIAIDAERKTVTVKNLADGSIYEESYDKLILSPGAEPVMPPIDGIDSDKVFTLRNIPDAERIKEYIACNHPKSIVVVGGGYIGIEMAENLKKAGLDVTIIELSDHLIASLDYEMAADVYHFLLEHGIKVILGDGVTSIADNKTSLTITMQNGQIQADMLLMAVGVRPETSLADRCGIRKNKRGAIITDSRMRTNIEDIYAVGDAIEIEQFVSKELGMIPLAGPANKQGRIAADNICGTVSTYTGTQGTAILKLFDMTVAATGLSEKAAAAAGLATDKTYLYSASHAGYYPGAKNMSIKVLWEKETHKLLGAQIVGFEGVDKRMDVMATAIRFGAKVTDLAELELCYAPPFGSAKDPVNMAGFVAENVITGKVKQFFWDEVEQLPRDGSVTLLDVRTTAEVSRGSIEGFSSIPLDSLRERMEEIPKNKPVYLHCQSGQRSYIAARVLTGYGYDCSHLAGGYRLYKSTQFSS